MSSTCIDTPRHVFILIFVISTAMESSVKGQLTGCNPNPCRNGGECTNGVCQCPLGFEGDLCETDVDDCADNPCQHGGTCVDGVNAFTCKCFPSFFGANCTESDCCYLNPCRNNGTCVDGLDNYMCVCPPGYEGDNCEREIDECLSNPCRNGGICIDAVDSFTCDCGTRGFDGGRKDVCRNSSGCDPNPCRNGATCNDLGNDSYVCQCTADYMGSLCSNVSRDLYSFGVSQMDVQAAASDDGVFGPVRIDLNCFPYGSKRHTSFYVSTNGLLSFDRPFASISPSFFPASTQTSVVAPFWADFDTRKGGEIFYHVYTDPSSSYLQRATRDVRNATATEPSEASDFTATWVLVATWHRVATYASRTGDGHNTFQVVVATDGVVTFALMNYLQDGLRWSDLSAAAAPAVGFTTDDGSHFVNHFLSKSSSVVSLAGQRLLYPLSLTGSCPENRKKRCVMWYEEDIDVHGCSRPFWTEFLLPCPFALSQIRNDFRFQFYGRRSGLTCFVSGVARSFGVQTECCYESDESFGGVLRLGPPSGGSANRHDSTLYPGLHKELDVSPYDDCCVYSDECRLYYERRPSTESQNYVPPTWGWMLGDPHFRTLDGVEYTFNGLGEYMLVKTSENDFVLQGRTMLVEGSAATAFSAVVAAQFRKSDDFTRAQLASSAVHVELTRGNGLSVWVCCYGNTRSLSNILPFTSYVAIGWRHISDLFSRLTETEMIALDGASLSRPDNETLVARFASGMSVRVDVKSRSLAVIWAAPDRFKGGTRGLLGVWDDDESNDFTGRNGESISIDSRDRQIHDLSQTWQLTPSESLFHYESGQNGASFSILGHVPSFLDEIEDRYTEEEKAACDNDKFCLYDAHESHNISVGTETLATRSQFLKSLNQLGNLPPVMEGGDVIKATVGVETVYNFNVSDDGAENVIMEGILPSSASLERVGNSFAFTWRPTSFASVSIHFVARNSLGLTSQLHPLVRLCACNLDGKASCVPAPGDGGEARFLLDDCQCGMGWEGRFCCIDIDGCLASNCYPNTACIDRPAPDLGFDCGECPTGYERDGDKCQDVDECAHDDLNNCSQICVNREPHFSCLCRPGYTLQENGVGCDNINECEKYRPCHQVCRDVDGSFSCSCHDGFHLDDDDVNCLANNETQCKGSSCEQLCYRHGDVETCSCLMGYRLDENNASCSDIDECDENMKNCDHRCSNNEGSFECECDDGYRLGKDGHSCEDVNECLNAATCADIDGHICENVIGSFRCSCPSGTHVVEKKCVLIDECASSPCRNGGICVDGLGEFTCRCTCGFAGDYCQQLAVDTPMFITPSASITSSPSTQREDVTALPQSDVSLALSWYWVLTVVVLCLVVALVTAYVVYLHFRKKNRRKADDEARRWREDIATSGQDDGSRVNTPATAAGPWNGPPSQASMREKRDPFLDIGRRKGAEVEVDSSRLPSVESVGKRKSPRAEPTLASLPDTPEPRYQQRPTKLPSLSKEKMAKTQPGLADSTSNAAAGDVPAPRSLHTTLGSLSPLRRVPDAHTTRDLHTKPSAETVPRTLQASLSLQQRGLPPVVSQEEANDFISAAHQSTTATQGDRARRSHSTNSSTPVVVPPRQSSDRLPPIRPEDSKQVESQSLSADVSFPQRTGLAQVSDRTHTMPVGHLPPIRAFTKPLLPPLPSRKLDDSITEESNT